MSADQKLDTAKHPDAGDGGAPRGRHAAADGAPVHPLIDLNRDPNRGRGDHAKDDD